MHLSIRLAEVVKKEIPFICYMIDRCIFHPLRGLKHPSKITPVIWSLDASFTPYGDWNCSVPDVLDDLVWCIFHPLRGLKLLRDINICGSRSRCIFHPLRGLKHLICMTISEIVWCIFHPLRGLKPLATLIKEDNTQMHLSPLTGIETYLWLSPLLLELAMHLSPLTGIETL